MKEVVIVDAIRTPVGKVGGTLKDLDAEQLITHLLASVVEKNDLDPSLVDEVIIGQTKISADAPNIARSALLKANFPISVPGYTLTRQCGSGMQTIINGVQSIMTGMADVVLAGGTESMSNSVYYLTGARFGYGMGDARLIDSNTESQPRSQPAERFGTFNMGTTAENLAKEYSISREEQDRFAHRSQVNAANAIENGYFNQEIVPVNVPQRRGDDLVFDTDEFPRLSSVEKLSKLKPVFAEDGTVTAGNASGRNDGAALTLIMSKEKALELGYKPLATIVSMATSGVDPRVMGIGPVEATEKALEKAGLTKGDIDLFEINEAFASQALACVKALNIDEEKVNVNGSGISLGHPLGCSGTRIVTTLVHELYRRGANYGVASICIAGGMGLALVVKTQ
ncbi:thiolase family protein [Photobacterium sp. DNB23_23_1]